MNVIRSLIAVILSIAIFWLLNFKHGDLPSVAPLLSPFTGFWQNNEKDGMPASQTIHLDGTKDEVQILMDENLVPHIFADNNYDLYFAQGYITAKYRLWQMEFETAAAAGRISEIIGEKAIEYDRQQRRLGMVYGAEQSLKDMQNDTECKEATDAYTAGVNAFIHELKPSQYPIEYKLLGYAPEDWAPLKCALLLMYMRYDLAGYSNDMQLTNILKEYGGETIAQLFPNYDSFTDPIIPRGTKWDFTPVPVPPVPADSFSADFIHANIPQPDPANGSNNWAVNGSKTKSGSPILCNDPHLSLNLPSIWYQLQMVSPDVNVYGVSLPGVPSVIIGFNQNIAWGVTNVGADVMDWYSLKFRDSTMNEYWYDSTWRKTTKRAEVIHVRGSDDVVDTVVYTHYGPVVAQTGATSFYDYVPHGCAMRWLALEGGKELKTFFELNRAKNYDDYVKALSYYSCPAQNFVYADADNNVALWVNGEFPLKWKGQGKFVLDGSNPQHNWQSFIPHDQDPHVKNPVRGFVSSANQLSADSTYPYYLNWDFEAFTRGMRINQRLSSMSNITIDSMRNLQFDDMNMFAHYVLPVLLPRMDNGLNNVAHQMLDSLKQWNEHDEANSIAASVFTRWWQYFKQDVWDDDFGSENMIYPHAETTIELLLHDTASKWFDDRTTPEVETITDIAQRSFSRAIDSLQKHLGPPGVAWQWGKVKGTSITHLLRLPAFSTPDVYVGGDKGLVNATGNDHGPSWRMIVQLGKAPEGYGIYPGGQSGNPGSSFYDNMIDKWSQGKLNSLVYLTNKSAGDKRIQSTITITK